VGLLFGNPVTESERVGSAALPLQRAAGLLASHIEVPHQELVDGRALRVQVVVTACVSFMETRGQPAKAELRVVSLIAQHDPESNSKLPRGGHVGLRDPSAEADQAKVSLESLQ
jgi:hypothetical protein